MSSPIGTQGNLNDKGERLDGYCGGGLSRSRGRHTGISTLGNRNEKHSSTKWGFPSEIQRSDRGEMDNYNSPSQDLRTA